MSARYPSPERRKQVAKARDAEMKRSLQEAEDYRPSLVTTGDTSAAVDPDVVAVVESRGHLGMVVDGPTLVHFTDLGDGLHLWAGQSVRFSVEMARELGEQLIAWADLRDPDTADEATPIVNLKALGLALRARHPELPLGRGRELVGEWLRSEKADAWDLGADHQARQAGVRPDLEWNTFAPHRRDTTTASEETSA